MTHLSVLPTEKQKIVRAAGLTELDVRAQFMLSDAREKIILGPVGSGKTYTTIHYLKHCIETKEPNDHGIRESWGLVVRNTKTEMETTIVTDWTGVFPEEKCGKVKAGGVGGSMEQLIEYDLDDGTKVCAAVQFVGVADSSNINRVMGANKTWAYFNEVRFISNEVYAGIYTRVGRTPAGHQVTDGWVGVVSDSNMAEPKHWLVKKVQEAYVCGAVVTSTQAGFSLPSYLPKTSEAKQIILDPLEPQLIENYELGKSMIFLQPPGAFWRKAQSRWDINPLAENLDRLGVEYYKSQFSVVTDQDYLLQNVGCEPKEVHSGVKVYTNFTPRVHILPDLIKEVSTISGLIVGIDLGWDNCAVFCELQKRQEIFQIRVLAEIPVDESRSRDITTFTQMCKEMMRLLTAHKQGDEVKYSAFCEFAAKNRSWASTSSSRTALDVMRDGGMELTPLPNITVHARVDILQNLFGFFCAKEKIPQILIDSSCKTLIASVEGGYAREQQKNNKEQVVTGRKDDPKKNTHSHIANALEYAVQGMKENHTELSNDVLTANQELNLIAGRQVSQVVDLRSIRMAEQNRSKIVKRPRAPKF